MIAAAYLRKSNDEGSKATDMKSVQLQHDEIEAFARDRRWTLDARYVFVDDGVSGATWGKARVGLRTLLDCLEPSPPFQVLLVTEPSRIGRDAIRTLGTVQTLEEAGVEVWGTAKRKQ